MTRSLIVPDSRGRELADTTPLMSRGDVLNLLNRTLDNSRASVDLAKAISGTQQQSSGQSRATRPIRAPY